MLNVKVPKMHPSLFQESYWSRLRSCSIYLRMDLGLLAWHWPQSRILVWGSEVHVHLRSRRSVQQQIQRTRGSCSKSNRQNDRESYFERAGIHCIKNRSFCCEYTGFCKSSNVIKWLTWRKRPWHERTRTSSSRSWILTACWRRSHE